MKKLTCVIFIVLAISAFASVSPRATAAAEGGSIAGAGRAAFGQGASFGSVVLSGIDFGTGVFTEPDGSATGAFSALLTGRSLLGQPKQITVDGNVVQGALAGNGQASFNGIATINFGDGTPSLSGVPFTVTATANSVLLTIGSTALPAAALSSGAVAIE